MTGSWPPWSLRYAALKPSRETRIRGGWEKLSGDSERKGQFAALMLLFALNVEDGWKKKGIPVYC